MSPAVEAWIAAATSARRVQCVEHIQTLWGGYGELFRVALEGGIAPTAVIKHVTPPANARDNVSDARKRRSYDVELAFYRTFAARCDDSCRVATLYAGNATEDEWRFVFEDLDAAGFEVRHDEAAPDALEACLAWLASFHARFIGDAGAGLWPIGTYWHLGTRRDELSAIADPVLRDKAEAIDAALAAARFQTILHGDPKDANFCFARDGRAVAAVDFQYAGRGCAMKDVAYLLYGRADEPPDGIARVYIDVYFSHLRRALAVRRDIDAAALETEWRALYPLARLDFCRFLAGWRPARWRNDHRGQRFVRTLLADLSL